MDRTQRRQRLRQVLQGTECITPATVFDPISARFADELGYPVAMLPGSVASAVVLGAPDVVVLTLPELAQQVRRITRYSNVALVVDADHGYGNALNVMRTVEELEAAGAAGLSLEDTLLPAAFGGQPEAMVSTAEMVKKLQAAVRARSDASLVVVARTNALRSGNVTECVERLKAYEQTGVDALFIVGATSLEHLEAVSQATSLPIVLGNLTGAPAAMSDRALVGKLRVRLALQWHYPFLAAVKAVYDTMKHLRDGGSIEALADRVASDELLRAATRRGVYTQLQKELLS